MLSTEVINKNSNMRSGSGYGYRETIVASNRINWRIEDVIGGGKRLDFSQLFMPDSLARVKQLSFLNADEQRILNQISGHGYLALFGLVEEFSLPFVLDHVRSSLDDDDYRVRAFLQFAGEEAKHIQLFKLFSEEFAAGFGTECKVIGPASDIAEEILSHQPLAVALLILHIEWMTQRHYLESVKGDQQIDPQFKSLLKHHWLEEAQHAKLDTLMVESIASTMSAEAVEKAVDEYLEMGGFLDTGLRQQTLFDLETFEKASGRRLSEAERDELIEVQHQSKRWTYLGTGMTHPKFLETLAHLDIEQRKRIEGVAPAFC